MGTLWIRIKNFTSGAVLFVEPALRLLGLRGSLEFAILGRRMRHIISSDLNDSIGHPISLYNHTILIMSPVLHCGSVEPILANVRIHIWQYCPQVDFDRRW